MALKKCKECGNEVSTSAKACPKCGAKVVKSVGPIGIIFALMVGFVAYSCSSVMNGISRHPTEQRTPAQTAAAQEEYQADKRRFDQAYDVAKTIRRNAKDPSSVTFNSIAVSGDADIVCVIFRAKNSFGAIVPGAYVLFAGELRDDARLVKKHCSNTKWMHDYTAAGG